MGEVETLQGEVETLGEVSDIRRGFNIRRGCENLFANLPTHVGWTVSVDMTQMMIMLK